jgi:hypothetical protein
VVLTPLRLAGAPASVSALATSLTPATSRSGQVSLGRFDLIEDEAQRRGAAGGVAFIIRLG